jgi:hypothetical protein
MLILSILPCMCHRHPFQLHLSSLSAQDTGREKLNSYKKRSSKPSLSLSVTD